MIINFLFLSLGLGTFTETLNDLKDDNIRGNCRKAVEKLELALGEAKNHRELVDELEKLLETGDGQQKYWATHLLITDLRKRKVPHYQWPSSLFRCLVDGLKNDEVKDNSSQGLDVIAKIDDPRMTALLWEGSQGNDPQGKFLCSYLLSYRLKGETSLKLTSYWVSQLKSDEVQKNGKLATRALYAMGAKNLSLWLDSDLFGELDDQQEAVVLWLTKVFSLVYAPNGKNLKIWKERKDRLDEVALFLFGERQGLKGRYLRKDLLEMPPEKLVWKLSSTCSFILPKKPPETPNISDSYFFTVMNF